MKKLYIFGLLLGMVVIAIGVFLMSPYSETYRLKSISQALDSGQPFIKVYDVREPPLEIDLAHGNLGLGTLWLVRVDETSTSSESKTHSELATISNNEPFNGSISFKEFDSTPVPITGEYYFNFISSDGSQLETKSNVFSIESNAAFVENFTIEPDTINKGGSSKLVWNTANSDGCSITYLDQKSNQNIVVKDSLPSAGSLVVNPSVSTFYSLRCNSTDIFEKNYPLAESWANESKWLFVK